MKKSFSTFFLTLALVLMSVVGANAQTHNVYLDEDFGTGGGSSASLSALKTLGWDTLGCVAGQYTSSTYHWGLKSGGVTGSCAYFYPYYYYVSEEILVSPQFTLDGTKDAVLTFKYKNGYDGGKLDVYVIESNGTRTQLDADLNPGSTWTSYEYSLKDFKGKAISIGFKGKAYSSYSYDYYYYIDDVVVEDAPDCQSAVGLTISNLTTNGAMLTWQAKGDGFGFVPSKFHISVVNVATGVTVLTDTTEDGTSSFSDFDYTFSTLDPNTTYRVAVLNDCSRDYKRDTASAYITFTTLKAAQNPPYLENFDSITTTLPDGCYSVGTVKIDNNTKYGTSGKSLKIVASETGDAAMFIMPSLNLAANNAEIEFQIKGPSANIKYKVGFLFDPTAPGDFIPILTDSTGGISSWREVACNSSASSISLTNVMFAILVESGASGDVYIDNIDIHQIPTCIRPENINVSNITNNTADVSWTTANAQNFEIRLHQDGGAWTTYTAIASPFTMTGLTANTKYDSITVQGICGGESSRIKTYATPFTTLCDVAASPLFTEGFESVSTTGIPQCWNMGWIVKVSGYGEKTAPFVTGATKHTGSKGMSLQDQPKGTKSYLSTATLPIDSADKYTLSIWVNRASASSYPNEGIQIWVTDYAGDTTGGTMLAYIHRDYASAPVESATGWYQYEYPIPVAGNKQITIIGISEYGNATYFDDMEVKLTPTCFKVTGVTVGNTTTNSTELSWTPTGTETDWIVQYTVKQGTTVVASDSSLVSGQPKVTINGLQPASTYVVTASVTAYCGAGDVAETVSMAAKSITTACETLTTFPYTEDFESQTTGVVPTCWTLTSTSTTTTASYLWSTFNISTSAGNCLRLYNSMVRAGFVAIDMPQMTFATAPMELNFDYSHRASCDPLVLLITDDNGATYDTLGSYPSGSSTSYSDPGTYTRVNIDLTAYANKTVSIRFATNTDYSAGSIFVDNINIREIPSCADLVGTITVTAVTDTSFSFTIADQTATEWQYAYGPKDTPIASLTPVSATGSAAVMISGLAAATSYDIYVRRECSGQYGAWSAVTTVMTMATPAQIPYTCGFEVESENNSWMFVQGANTLNHFTIGTFASAVETGSKSIYLTTATNGSNNSYDYSTSSRNYAYRTINFEAKGYTVSLDWKCNAGEGTGTIWDYARIMLVPASEPLPAGQQGTNKSSTDATSGGFPTNAIFFDPEGSHWISLAGAGQWHSVSKFVDMTNQTPGLWNLVLVWNNDGSSYTTITEALAVDNISIVELTCIPPSTTLVSDITPNSANINIQQTGATEWEVLIDDSIFDARTIPADPMYRQITTNATVALTGLTPNTQYYYTVRNICGPQDTSDWKTPIDQFQTFCSAVQIPLTEGFEGVTSTNCWTSNSATGSISRSTTIKHAGKASMMVKASTAISPEFNTTSLEGYMLNGWYYTSADSVVFTVGALTDPNDVSTFMPLVDVTVPASAKSQWTEFTTYFSDLSEEEDPQDYKYVAIATQSNTIYFDDFIIDEVPTCPKPTETVISNVTDTSFTISYTNNAPNATKWIVYTNGEEHVVTTNPAVVSGLEPATNYNVSMVAFCSATDTSYVTTVGTIRTECAITKLPYLCGFEISEGFPSGTSYVAGALETNCWNTLNISSSIPYYYFSSSAAHSGTRGLYGVTGSKYGYFILPIFNVDINNLTMDFWYATEEYEDWYGSYTYSNIQVGYMTDATADSTFVLIETLAQSTESMTKHTTSFAGRSIPTGARIAFRYDGDDTYLSVGIDDISVKEIRSCSDPDAPVVSNISAYSASVQFSDTCATHTDWEYVYGVQGFNPDQATPITLDTNVVELSGLTGETSYTVYLRAVCGVNDYSNWVGTSFRTLCTPFNVSVANPFYDAFEEYSYNDDLSNSCYTISTPASSGSYYTSNFYVYPTSAPSSTSSYRYIYSHNGDYTNKCLNFYYYSAANPDGFYMIRQMHLEAGKTYEASMWARNTNSSAVLPVSILIGQNGVPAQMDTLKSANIAYASYNSSSQGGIYIYDYSVCYSQIKTVFTVQSTGDYHVAFTANYPQGAVYMGGYFDELQIREFDGCAPAPVALDSITATSVKVTIADQDPNHSFEYVLNDTTLQSTVVTSNNFTISGLASSSSYTLYVRVLCDQTNHSEWMTEQFNTLCGSINTFPYFNDFEGYPANSTPNCWDISSSSSSTASSSPYYIWGVYNYNSNNMLRMYNYYVQRGTANIETPVFELPAQPVEMQFDYSHLANCNAWQLKASTDNGATYTELASYTATSTSYDYTNPGTFTHAIVDLTAYANQNVKFMFASTSTYGQGAIFLDNLQVSFVPPCREPQTAPVIASSTMTTMTVTAGMAGKDTIEFGIAPHSATVTSADIVDSVVSATGTATFQGLTGNTRYAVWYRYHCGEDGISGWSLAYANNTTTSTDCFAPQSLRTVGIVNDHHAAITWGKAPEAVNYEYMLISGGAVLDSAVNLNDTIVYDSLTANTAYTFKARTLCGTDTSAWATINFTTTYPCFSLPFICDFEDPTINSGWRLSDVYTGGSSNNLFAIGNATSNGGATSLYVSQDGGATNTYNTSGNSVCDAEILLEMTAGNYTVSYDWNAYGEGGYAVYDFGRVFLIPSTETITSPYYYTYRTLPTGAISLDGETPLQLASGWTNYQSVFSVPSDNVYKLVVLWGNDGSGDQPPLAVDNIRIEVANCMPLASVTALAVNATSVKVAINRYDATNDAEYGYSTVDSQDSITWTVIPGGQKIDTVKLTGLNPQTSYYFYAREVCDSGNVSSATRLALTTPTIPQTIPFVCSFEPSQTTTTAWQYANGANAFVVGGATATDGTQALYISNNGSAWTYEKSTTTTSYAYVPLAFGPGTYEISFDWQANGESTCDYGRAFLAPTSFVPTADADPSGLSSSSTPTGWISLDGNAKMNLVTEWKSVYIEKSFTDSVTWNLLFYWHNDFSQGNDNPFGVDNIRINQQTCPTMKLDSISTDTITEDMMIVRYVNTNVGASTRWVVFRDAQRTDTLASGVNLATDSTITLQGLSAGTSYYFSLYSVCSPTDESRALEFYVRTVCANTVLPYNEGFENMKPNTYNMLTANCWYTTTMTQALNSFADATDPHNGTYSLIVNNGYNGGTQVLALPEMDSINGLNVSFWHMAYGTYSYYASLKFGYMNANNTFVSLQSLTKNTSWSEYTTVTSGIPAGVNRLAFQITGEYYYFLDDIRVNKLVAGRDIYDTICNGVAYNKYGVSIPARRLNTGDTTFTQTILGTTAGEADSLATIHLYVRPAIMTVINDTVCQGQSYNKHGFNIGTPQTSQYTQTTTATCGCDSSLVLNLYVMPVTATLRDTICQGDVYQFGSQSLTQPGTYVDTVPSGYGCDIQRTLYLFVVDSTTTTRATICEGTSYRFEGQDYTQTGIYRVPSTGLHGCSLTKILDLTVTKTVRDIDTSFCKGGQLIIADGRVITTPGTYTCTIADEPTGCTTTYNYTVSEDPIISATATDDACENHTYTGLGGLVDRRITKDTTFTVTTRTIDAKCDSQCVVTIKLVKAIWAQPDVVDKPAGESYTWHGNTYNTSVVVQDTLQSIVTGCDSICKLILTIGGVPPVAVENVELLEISLIPNPVTAGQTSFIYGNFSDVKNVEVLNSFGQVVDSFVPSTYPIEVQGINASGIYYVRITTEDERVAVQKLIVK